MLLHGGTPKGAERIAACWADNQQGAADRLQARLDPPRQGRAVQAQRSDAGRPAIGVIVFPGSGISANLADKAKKLGIPVWKFGAGGA